MQKINSGVTAPKGFLAGGVHCGVKTNNTAKKDIAIIYSEKPCTAAAVYTQNKVFGAPITVTRRNIADGMAQAVVCNSGNANTCNADGVEKAEKMCVLAAEALHLKPEDIIVASTGVIGQVLPIEPIEKGITALAPIISREGNLDAVQAIMTTDTKPKEEAYEIEIGGKTVKIGAMAKGSGMIHPNMATMLCVMSTDAALTEEAAHEALLAAVKQTFNKVTVDSDTSTNDTAVLLATGKAAPAGERIGLDSPAYPALAAGIKAVCGELARKIAADGEGSTKLVTVNVLGAANDADADTVARSIANSPLVKTAIFGHDANWGRVAAAAGKCGVAFDQSRVDIDFMGVPVCRAGLTVPMDEDDMLRRFEAPEIDIAVDLHDGDASCRIWTCDLTHDYVAINGDYRT